MPQPPAVESPAETPRSAKKKIKDKALFWNPPNVDAGLRSQADAPECDLSEVLAEAAVRATELVTNLQNFTAQEHIVYRVLGGGAAQLDSGLGDFDYTAVFERRKQGYAVRESRTPEHGTQTFAAAAKDVGLPEMALIFLPDFQVSYEMKCAGAADWNGRPAWIVQLRQRKDRLDRTASFVANNGNVYPAPLKGSAWIAQDSGEVMHLEVALTHPIQPISVMEWFLSIDYAPVQFRTGNLRLWLPQYAEAYGNYDTRRTIASHRFSNFLLFSVQTDQVIANPKSP